MFISNGIEHFSTLTNGSPQYIWKWSAELVHGLCTGFNREAVTLFARCNRVAVRVVGVLCATCRPFARRFA